MRYWRVRLFEYRIASDSQQIAISALEVSAVSPRFSDEHPVEPTEASQTYGITHTRKWQRN
jgi:hypothetical protein